MRLAPLLSCSFLAFSLFVACSSEEEEAPQDSAPRSGSGGKASGGKSGSGGAGAGQAGGAGSGQGGAAAGTSSAGSGGAAGAPAGSGGAAAGSTGAGAGGAAAGQGGDAGSGQAGSAGSGQGGAGQGGSGNAGTGQAGTGQAGTGQAGSGGAEPGCNAPDFLIVLDRSRSMHRLPGGGVPAKGQESASRWAIAIDTIEKLVAKQTPAGVADQTARFGLELFPKESNGCETLTQAIAGEPATNGDCKGPEVLVQPALGTGGAIAAALDPLATKICISTPIAGALEHVVATFLPVWSADKDRKHSVVLVTDGGESCKTDDAVIAAVKELAKADITTFAIGFGGDSSSDTVNPTLMNRLTCAGKTAPDPAQNCKQVADGLDPVDPKGAKLFLDAKDAEGLSASLLGALESLCCGCKP